MASAVFGNSKMASKASDASPFLASLFIRLMRRRKHDAHLLYKTNYFKAPNRSLHLKDIKLLVQILLAIYLIIVVTFWFELILANY